MLSGRAANFVRQSYGGVRHEALQCQHPPHLTMTRCWPCNCLEYLH